MNTKKHPLTYFREQAEGRAKSLRKAQYGDQNKKEETPEERFARLNNERLEESKKKKEAYAMADSERRQQLVNQVGASINDYPSYMPAQGGFAKKGGSTGLKKKKRGK